MTRDSDDPWGARPWPVWKAGLRDRISGARARANARDGFLRKPPGRGRVLWIKAGGTPLSLRLGVELLGAIRQKRHDLRLVLTFELDDERILAPRLEGLRATGVGYGPSDRPRTVRRVLERLEPFGLILADTLPRANLLRAAGESGVHCVAFNTAPWPCRAEAAYPRDQFEREAWSTCGMAGSVVAAADPVSLWVEARADVTLRALSGAGESGRLWWWHGPAREADAWIGVWRADGRFAADRLFVSLCDVATVPLRGATRISRWDRGALTPGEVMWVDDPRWLAAVSSACTAGHLHGGARDVFWQGLAGGRPLSAGRMLANALPVSACLPMGESPAVVLDRWAAYAEDPMGARREGDAGRRRFWEERRRVESVMSEFLQRVFDW